MVNSMNDLNHESKTKDKYNSHLTITQRKRKNVKIWPVGTSWRRL